MEKQSIRAILATHNAGKIAELRDELSSLGWLISGLDDHGLTPPEETGRTFEENALLKASVAAAKTGLWALADDSGLEVDFLGGLPGVDTSDYGGWQKLLEVMKHLPTEQRTARFRCVLVLVRDGYEPLYFKGACEGLITLEPLGDGGFAFDPVFQPLGETRTFAEMSKTEKSALSHRGQALREFLTWAAQQQDM